MPRKFIHRNIYSSPFPITQRVKILYQSRKTGPSMLYIPYIPTSKYSMLHFSEFDPNIYVVIIDAILFSPHCSSTFRNRNQPSYSLVVGKSWTLSCYIIDIHANIGNLTRIGLYLHVTTVVGALLIETYSNSMVFT